MDLGSYCWMRTDFPVHIDPVLEGAAKYYILGSQEHTSGPPQGTAGPLSIPKCSLQIIATEFGLLDSLVEDVEAERSRFFYSASILYSI